jgi:hypothetical protein
MTTVPAEQVTAAGLPDPVRRMSRPSPMNG